jgi:hypothetical protein
MTYFLENWGSFVGVLSLIITIIGFFIAIRRATEARTASREARAAVIKVLSTADLQRAIALIQRLKDLHRDSKWETSLEHYQPLRAMLADINSRLPLPSSEQRATLQQAITDISIMETGLTLALLEDRDPLREGNSYEVLNVLQAMLEQIASSTYFPGSEAGG